MSAEATPGVESAPRVRFQVAVIVTRFPRIGEFHVLREINELERQGQPIVLAHLFRNRSRVFHDEVRPWLDRSVGLPTFPLRLLLANLRRLVASPLRYLRTLWALIAGTWADLPAMLRSLACFPAAAWFAERFEELGIQHVHAYGAMDATTVAWAIRELGGPEFSFTVQGPDVFVRRVLMSRKLSGARFVRTVSTFNKAFLSGLYPGIGEEKTHVVHFGVEPSPARPTDGSETTGSLRLLSVLTLAPNKGLEPLVEACALLEREGVPFDAAIIGGGPLRAEIDGWIRRHGLSHRIHLTGALTHREVLRHIEDCDVFVSPSVIAPDGQMDGIPVSLIEAMAAGRPVIAAALSGIPELVANGVTGLLVDATQPRRIADAVKQLHADPALRRRLGEAGRSRVEQSLDVRTTARTLLALLERQQVADEPSVRVADFDWARLGVVALGVRAIHERADSLIATATISNGTDAREVVLKQHRMRDGQSRDPEERARDEHETLRHVRRALAETNAEETADVSYGVPRIEGFVPEQAALVLSRARGRALDALIRDARTRGHARTLVVPLRRTGVWLRLMQRSLEKSSDGRHVLTALVLLAQRDLDLAAAGDRAIGRRHGLIASRLRALESSLAERGVPLAAHHGDYWPGNVFVGERSIDVIDFEGFREGLPLEDVAWFVLHLELYFSYPVYRRIFPRLERAFLDGFLGATTPLDRPQLQLCMIAKSLQLLAHGGAPQAGTPRAWWNRRTLRRILERNLA